MIRKLRFFIPLFTLIVALDQWSKWYVSEIYFKQTDALSFWQWLTQTGQARRLFDSEAVTSFLNMVIVWNPGISFGMFAGNDPAMNVTILSTLAFVISLIFMILFFRKENRTQWVAISLIVAGAMANVWDRLRFGAVFDFIDLHYAGWHYPAFNVADSAITIGVFIYVYYELFRVQHETNPLAKKVGRWHDD